MFLPSTWLAFLCHFSMLVWEDVWMTVMTIPMVTNLCSTFTLPCLLVCPLPFCPLVSVLCLCYALPFWQPFPPPILPPVCRFANFPCASATVCARSSSPKYGLVADRYHFCEKCFNEIQGHNVTLGDDPAQPQTWVNPSLLTLFSTSSHSNSNRVLFFIQVFAVNVCFMSWFNRVI